MTTLGKSINYKDYKKETQKQYRRSHDAYVQNLITEDRSNKKFWAYIKSQRKEKTGIADILDRNTWVTDPKQKANLFNAQFSKVFFETRRIVYRSPSFR